MACKAPSLFSSLLRQARPRAFTARPATRFLGATIPQPITIRLAHSIPRPPPVTPRDSSSSSTSTPSTPKSESPRPAVPQNNSAENPYYQLSFTCVPCGHRSHHNISKQGYHTGSTLISCPECRNRHIISDHLGIFTDTKGVTVEDIVREKGQLVKRGSLGEDGDIEFWPDDTPEKAQ